MASEWQKRRMRRRARARQLRDEGLSMADIAARLGCGKATVIRDLAEGPAGSPVPNHAGPGNLRAVQAGTRSERLLAPIRERRAVELRERFPWMDSGRVAVQAQRLAQCELGAAWLDTQGGVVRDDEGNVFDVADKVQKWSAAAERWFEAAEAESRAQRRGSAYEALLAEEDERDA